MDTKQRMSELALDFQRRATRKHRELGLAGDAFIRNIGNAKFGYCYTIAYRNGSGETTGGVGIGATRVQAIKWLLQQRKDWP